MPSGSPSRDAKLDEERWVFLLHSQGLLGASCTDSCFDDQLNEERLAGAELVERSRIVAVIRDDDHGPALRVADYACIAFTTADFEGERQRAAQENAPALMNPRARSLLQDISLMGPFQRRSVKTPAQKGVRYAAAAAPATAPPRSSATPVPSGGSFGLDPACKKQVTEDQASQPATLLKRLTLAPNLERARPVAPLSGRRLSQHTTC
eukprot:CAMPEP_0179366006 /NCGR_PEP_ID=MMETSP0797-20121207/82840_1 /TAXON_ID=47934 /ORGANISM="Dinophysis acuminata, Strain DAEP01" /LENGTH=207 /DNA_ID=CAMNT_0021081519 /DNA_START=1 /DNA_END=622 /DNA_ORIENTATION=-